jgi:F-type H+-transporting ATPase subunit b
MEIIATNALITINETFVVQLVSFLIFLYVINRLMFRPLISTMEQRKTYLADVKTDIENAKLDLENLNIELENQRLEVHKEADAAVNLICDEGDKQAKQLFEAARAQITALRQETEAKVSQQVADARSQMAGELEAVTTAIMEKVLYRRLKS